MESAEWHDRLIALTRRYDAVLSKLNDAAKRRLADDSPITEEEQQLLEDLEANIEDWKALPSEWDLDDDCPDDDEVEGV